MRRILKFVWVFANSHSSHSPLNLWALFAQQPAKGCGFLLSQE